MTDYFWFTSFMVFLCWLKKGFQRVIPYELSYVYFFCPFCTSFFNWKYN